MIDRTGISAFVAAIFVVAAAPGWSADGQDMVAALDGICLTSLESGAAVGPGLTRAGPNVEAKLLNGKRAKIWRTWNAKVVIVAHDGGRTCEIMGINIDAGEFGFALRNWNKADGHAFQLAEGENITASTPGGAYLASRTDDGEFIQVFVQSQPEARFIGITAARVADSEQAREVLSQ